MGRYIIKIKDSEYNKDYYLEWSSIVDAPVTYGMSIDGFKEYYLKQYGLSTMDKLEGRLIRVEKQGTSCMLGQNIDEMIAYNRAGVNECELTKEEILNEFCRR